MVVRNLRFRRGVRLKVHRQFRHGLAGQSDLDALMRGHRQFDRLVRFGVVRERVSQDPRVRVREVGARTENMVAEPGARPESRDSYLACTTIISSQPAVHSIILAGRAAGSSAQQAKNSSLEFDRS